MHLSGPLLGSEAVAAGVLTRAQLRGPLVRRLFRGVYLPVGEPLTPVVRIRAATLVLPGSAFITGRSAAAVRGVSLGWADADVEVAVPEDDHFGPVRGLHVVRTTVASSDSVPWEHGRLATPARAAFDLVRWRPLRSTSPTPDRSRRRSPRSGCTSSWPGSTRGRSATW